MKSLQYSIFLVLIGFLIVRCKSAEQPFPKRDLSYQDKWQYFTFQDTLTLEVINHFKSVAHCGTLAFASVTIGVTNKDTIRVINLCNRENYIQGQIVKFVPAEKPPFTVNLPNSEIYSKEEQKFIPIVYDRHLVRTTYGSAIR